MKVRSLAAALAILAFAQSARAQSPRVNEGITLMGGAGVGWTRAACGYCRRSLDSGPVIYLQMTAPMRTNLSLGAEGNVWVRDAQVFSLMGSLSAIAQLYPKAGSPLYLKGGLGFVTYRAYDDEADLVSNAPALQLGGGYRFRISDELALSNFANILVSRFGKLRSEETVVVDNFGVTSIQLGVGLTRH
jgi:hypothetical protein